LRRSPAIPTPPWPGAGGGGPPPWMSKEESVGKEEGITRVTALEVGPG
jgi:hypothetical protein